MTVSADAAPVGGTQVGGGEGGGVGADLGGAERPHCDRNGVVRGLVTWPSLMKTLAPLDPVIWRVNEGIGVAAFQGVPVRSRDESQM